MRRILLIDDDALLAAPLATFFGRFEFALDAAVRPSAGLEMLRGTAYDAVILDVMLPEMDGFELCRTIRRESDIPIVMLTARGDVMDRVVGLEIGADDYLPKPFEPRELLARLQTVLRRARAPAAANPKRLVFDGLQIDLERRQVECAGAPVELTGTEFDLLVLLASEPQKVFNRDEILNRLRGIEAELHTRAVDILISRLPQEARTARPDQDASQRRLHFRRGTRVTGALRRGWRRARHSLRTRLTLLFLLLALAMTLTFVGAMQAVARSGWQELARPLIANYVDRLVAEIGTPPDPAKAEALTRTLPIRIRIEGPVVNWSSRGGAEAGSEWRDRYRRGLEHDSDRPPSPWRPTRLLADGHRISFGLASLPRDDAPEDRPRLIGWATLLLLLALVALAYARVRSLLRPLGEIRAGAIRYGAGDFSRRIPGRAQDELGELAQQVNGMADGLHGLLEAKRGLLLAISHELRSPLTRARLNAELVDAGSARDALLHDLAEMRDLITDLLESERLTGGHTALHTEPTDLNTLVRDVLDAQFAGRGVTLALDPNLPAATVDATRIKLLLRNLIDNALRAQRRGAFTNDRHDRVRCRRAGAEGARPRPRGRRITAAFAGPGLLPARQRPPARDRRRRARALPVPPGRAGASRHADADECASRAAGRAATAAKPQPSVAVAVRYFFNVFFSQSRSAVSVFVTCLAGFRLW